MNRPKEDETKCVRKEEKKRNRGKVAERPMTWRELYRNGDPDGYFYFNFREGESAHARRKIKKTTIGVYTMLQSLHHVIQYFDFRKRRLQTGFFLPFILLIIKLKMNASAMARPKKVAAKMRSSRDGSSAVPARAVGLGVPRVFFTCNGVIIFL